MDYSGINAKIKAMQGRLLTREFYAALCAMSSVESAGKKLRGLPAYQKAMTDVDDEELHRGVIEQKIILSLSDDFKRLYQFLSDFRIRKYLDAFLMSREIDSYTAEGSLFEIENQQDLFYYMNLWKRQKQYLDAANRTLMEKIKGIEVDMRNIMWIYRLRKFYRMNDARIFAFLIPICYKLDRAGLMRMAQSKTLAQLADEIARSPYGAAFSDLENLEKSYFAEMARVYRQTALLHPKSLAPLVSYLFFKETEIKNLISLLEGVRYQLPPQEILLFLNLPNETEVRRWSSE
jgi:vacuolar-type H+-ATPase subunit C/Vma6